MSGTVGLKSHFEDSIESRQLLIPKPALLSVADVLTGFVIHLKSVVLVSIGRYVGSIL